MRHRAVMTGRLRASLAITCASALVPWNATTAAPVARPLQFFEGRTESVGTMKAMLKKPYRVRSIGQGTIAADGALTLVQQVRDGGDPPKQRIWKIRQVSPTKFTGTMSDAVGPVTIEQVGEGYRFRFKLRGGLSAEQWLVPSSDGQSGSSSLVVRKFGMTVARSEGTIRKVSQQARQNARD